MEAHQGTRGIVSQCALGVTIGLHMSMVSMDVLTDTLRVRYCHSYTMIHTCGFSTKKEHDII